MAVPFKCSTLILFTLFSLQFLFADQETLIDLSGEEQAWLDQNYTVKVRVGEWPPFQFYDEGYKGISVDYIKKIFEIHGIAYEFVSGTSIPWSEALKKISDHSGVDLILTAMVTEERKKHMIFTDEYLFLPWVIFDRTDSPFISGIDDLNGKMVSVPEGFVIHDLLVKDYPEINLLTISEGGAQEICLDLLAKGQVDAYIGNLTAGSYVILNRGYNNLKVAAPTPFGNHDQAMAIRDDWSELVGIINKTLDTFTAEDHSNIKNNWLAVRYEYGITPSDVLRWILVIFLVFLVLFTFYFLWNRRLKKEIETRKLIEKKLFVSEKKFRSLSEASFEGILIVDSNKILNANKAVRDMFGYSVETLGTMDAIELVASEDRRLVIAFMNKETLSCEVRGVKKTGELFPVEIQKKSFLLEDRLVDVIAVRDITEKKKDSEHIKTLQGILPICSKCKQIRDDKGYWNNLEEYISKHSLADFSHGLCPDCARELYPGFTIKDKN